MHQTSAMTDEFRSDDRQHKRLPLAFKSPQRITITIAHSIYHQLAQRSDQEGRSLSNLAAFLLESALSKPPASH
jgi:CopG-like RHH_1 or ribbon-helix-helix domain, RHH_5